jgi:hypothetical protein
LVVVSTLPERDGHLALTSIEGSLRLNDDNETQFKNRTAQKTDLAFKKVEHIRDEFFTPKR